MKKLFLALLLVSSPSFAADFKCPDKIETNQSVKTEEPGWSAIQDTYNGSQTLERVSLYDGHPREGASLVPDNEVNSKNSVWTNHSEKGLWVACVYSQSTVRLMKEIPKNVKKCTLEFKKKEFGKLVCL